MLSQNVVKHNKEFKRIVQIVSQTLYPKPKHDKIWAWWISNNFSKNILERVWWCKCFEMEFKNQTIYPISCSKGGRHACVKANNRSQIVHVV
jgi:hypothetical protein